ncbi:MAG: nucleotide exchange factor GrpE [Prochlorococcaceae cyanobacterium]
MSGEIHPGDTPSDGMAPDDTVETLSSAGDADAGTITDGHPQAEQAAGASPEGAPVGQGQLQQLEAELEALRAEHETLRGQYMRMAADFDNFRKRQSRDLDDQRHQIAAGTLSEILPVVDNFDRARQQLNPQHEEAQTLHRSYQGLYKQLVDVFKQLGVAPMRVEGEPFDPSLHEAVLREPSHDHPEDVVIEELQRGYQLNGRVLRHALVKVSMGPGPGAPAASEEQGG